MHTLGPAGTNCELAARHWFERQGAHAEIVLHPTLEDAARAALATPGGALLAPAAYPDLHTLMYVHIGQLTIVDSLVMPTHPMVLARRPGVEIITSVSSHPAPVALIPEGTKVELVSSNARAASDCAAGRSDGCITTSAAMAENGLELVQDFGALSMAFTVHLPSDS
ncbi:MAG: hypothetical protein M3179_05565 [Actinomycetota bacterium]|nr:hypothetical protein [Actinomycetota bacterium]